jgi:site-specific recombinase XerD
MTSHIVRSDAQIQPSKKETIPPLIVEAGDRARYLFAEFFSAEIENPNTQQAYWQAVKQFSWWCEDRGIGLLQLTPVHVAAYRKELKELVSKPTVKQHLSALRKFFDHLVTGQVLPANPAAAVKAPKHVVRKGKTPVLTADETRQLLDSIDTSKIAGLRDRALIGVMVFSFARVSAVLSMNVEDYYLKGRRSHFRLDEKGGIDHEVPAHHKAEEYVDAYLAAAGIGEQKKTPLFRSINSKRQLTERRLDRHRAWAMIKRRARKAELSENVSPHSFRATGITAYLTNGGSLEMAQQIAAHASPRTTKLYDRRNDDITLDEIEKIII